MKRVESELLSNGVIIDWSNQQEIKTESGKQNFQRKISVSCLKCNKYRYVNSCAIWQIRKGKQTHCWDCHKQNLAGRNSTGVLGRHKNKHGYIIRTLSSFTTEELTFLQPMLRKGGKKKATEILEHRAIYALHYKIIIEKNFIIHHINGIKDDNRIENLELLSKDIHSREHKLMINKLSEAYLKIEQLRAILKAHGIENE